MPTAEPVTEPFPIYAINGRYMLFDVNVVSHVRAKHRMCGCLTGTLPQIPQQNVFLGLPLELMTEEAALLVEKGAAYVVDDVAAHKKGLAEIREEDKRRYLKEREEACLAEALEHQKAADERKAQYNRPAEKKGEKKKKEEKRLEEEEQVKEEEHSLFGSDTPSETASIISESTTSAEDTPLESTPSETPAATSGKATPSESEAPTSSASDSFFPTTNETPLEPDPTPAPAAAAATVLHPQSLLFFPTATVSSPVYHAPEPSSLIPRPNPSSYPLYKHLHAAGYFLSPGLRFGCQFMAYPGDPLRFHSHFIARGLGWDEEVDMIDIVGGGRLGTGVKKAWMFGGQPEEEDGVQPEARVFCVEWGGF